MISMVKGWLNKSWDVHNRILSKTELIEKHWLIYKTFIIKLWRLKWDLKGHSREIRWKGGVLRCGCGLHVPVKVWCVEISPLWRLPNNYESDDFYSDLLGGWGAFGKRIGLDLSIINTSGFTVRWGETRRGLHWWTCAPLCLSSCTLCLLRTLPRRWSSDLGPWNSRTLR